MKYNVSRKLISFYWHHATNNNKNSFSNDTSYTLYYDKETKGIYKAEAKNINTPTFIFLFLIIFPIMSFFPNNFIPYENKVYFISLTLVVIFFSITVGWYLSNRLNNNLRRVTLSKEEWKYYLEHGNKLYLRQISVMTIILLFVIACFIFLYIYQSKWWMFGGIGTGVVVGTSITLFSRTRYLLYKNRVDVNLNNGGIENEDIADW